MTDPGGNVTQVTSRNASGEIAEVQRSSTGVTESFLYTYVSSGVDAGLVQNITWRRSTDGGNAWSTVRQAVFSYYDGTQPYGNVGDLQFLSLDDASGKVLGTTYYRYYTSADAGNGGYVHGLKYFFSEQSYARLAAGVGDPTTATDSQVSAYADDYLQYESQDFLHLISQEVVQGQGCSTCSAGLGAFTYTYTFSNNPAGYNSWYVKTVETHPDGSTETIYTNAYSEIMLDAFTDAATGITTETYYRYDNAGHVILMANPSAVTGHDDSYADLVNYQNGTFQYLSTNSGLITLTDYYASTTATETTPGGVAGYVQDDKIEHGYQGTPILQDSFTYFLRTGGGVSYAPTAASTVYRNDDGTGAETTAYAYTWFANSVQMESMTTTLPVISAAQNGPGVADQSVSFFDSFGRDVWDKNGDAYINYTAYDAATGAVVESIVDVNTADTGEFQNLPAGWQTPPGGGLNLVTTYQVDNLGRSTEEIDPKGTITYTTYDDVNHEARTYAGWNAGTGMPTGPTQVYRQDWANGYTETLTMAAAVHLTNGVPDGTEPIGDVQTLSRSYTNTAGQVVREDDYFNLAGLAYSTALYIGTVNTNYYATTFGYDDAGRENHMQSPTGTITDTVYDGRGDVLSTWVGTNDTPLSGEWSPANNTGTANMVEVSANVYDNGGAGDDNLTQTTRFPGGSDAPRVMQYFFDWRDRQVAEKDGVQTSEKDGTHRPIYFTTYDNLDEAIAQAMYTGDGVTIQTVNGEPQAPARHLLRAYGTIQYDDQGRVFRRNVFAVTPGGVISKHSLSTNFYFDHRGDPIATSSPGGLWTKDVYDGAGRRTVEYTTDGGSGTTWADASTVANDTVLEQVQTLYDPNSNPVETIDAQRLPGATGTGSLGNPTTEPYARVY